MIIEPAIHRVELSAEFRLNDIGILVNPRRVYLAGPMTGHPEHNYPAFHAAAEALRRCGHAVYNPADFDGSVWGVLPGEDFPIREAFARYTAFITREAEAVVVLDGWEMSRGALAETALARVLGLPIVSFSRWLASPLAAPRLETLVMKGVYDAGD